MEAESEANASAGFASADIVDRRRRRTVAARIGLRHRRDRPPMTGDERWPVGPSIRFAVMLSLLGWVAIGVAIWAFVA